KRVVNLILFVITVTLLVVLAPRVNWLGMHFGSIAHPQRTEGIITTYDESIHGSYLYAFSVGKDTYTGRHYPYECAPTNPTIGQRVSVFFDTRNPSNSSLCDPGGYGRNSWGWLGTIFIISCALLAWGVRRTLGRQRAQFQKLP